MITIADYVGGPYLQEEVESSEMEVTREVKVGKAACTWHWQHNSMKEISLISMPGMICGALMRIENVDQICATKLNC